MADLAERRIWRPDGVRWDVRGLLDVARDLATRGPVLVGLDLVLGLPAGYWRMAVGTPRRRVCRTFADWLTTLEGDTRFFETVRDPRQWSVEHPFFHVPPGPGGLSRFDALVSGGMRRAVERRTGGKPVFAVSGIPGTVGSGSRAFWLELIPLLREPRDFGLWPFEGTLEAVRRDRPIVLAEAYPGLAYSVALSDRLPAPRLRVGKTKRDEREAFCDRLESASWLERCALDPGCLEDARRDEDCFDSFLMAAAVLRCALAGCELVDPAQVDAIAEGGMLLIGPVNPGLPSRRFESVP